jgi:predicted amidophosphoribosyltransferase
MFCPSCGAAYTIELKYCNRCGANLTTTLAEPNEVPSLDLTKAIATIGTTMTALTLGGFIALIVGAVKLSEKTNMGSDPIMFTVLLGMIVILTADIFLGVQ